MRYVWFWGWLVYSAIAIPWPLYIIHRYPAIKELWFFDYQGTEEFDQSAWYYPLQLLGCLAPWTPAVVLGLWALVRQAFRRSAVGADQGNELRAVEQPSPHLVAAARFIVCWAIVPIFVLSIPHRKHHHYLVPSLAPWAIAATIGLPYFARAMFGGPVWSRRPLFGVLTIGLPVAIAIAALHRRIPGPAGGKVLLGTVWLLCVGGFYVGLHRRNRSALLASVLFGIVMCMGWGQVSIPEDTFDDTAFLNRVKTYLAQHPGWLGINANLHGQLDFFRNQFYLGDGIHQLHNLTFLRDKEIPNGEVYVVTRFRDLHTLMTMGWVEAIDQSPHTRRETSPADRFTLFRLTLDPSLPRFTAPPPDLITTMEAMGRKKGPFLGESVR